MRDRARRVIETCRQIATMSEEPGRTTRRYLTDPVRDVHALLRSRMEALDMAVRVDAVGNLRGVTSGAGGKRLVMGSHIDTVPDAGAFDGVLGVVIALEWVELAREAGLKIPFEVIAFSEEEGVRFVPFIGSRAVAGGWDRALLETRDQNGSTLRDVIVGYGLDPRAISEAAIDQNVFGFVEVHIEQGPVLDAEKVGVAAVTGIAGQTRALVRFDGHANHAGTTPMKLRHDALAAAAEWIAAVERIARSIPDLVATVGWIEVSPNVSNVIAGSAGVSLDCRHAEDTVRIAAVSKLRMKAEQIAHRRGVSLHWQERANQSAVPMNELLTARLVAAIHEAGFPPKLMVSGAGHDAMIMAAIMPTAMLFLRSPDGVSHHPSESVLVEDVEAALAVGSKFLERLAGEVR